MPLPTLPLPQDDARRSRGFSLRLKVVYTPEMENKLARAAKFIEEHLWSFVSRVVLFVAALSVIFLAWIEAIRLVRGSDVLSLPRADLATILFGAASLALFVLSIGIGVLAIFGWKSLQDAIRGQVKEDVNKLESEMRGRTLSTIGYLAGEMSLKFTESEVEIVDKERFAECIENCYKGYEFLSRVGGPGKYMALNNLLYYGIIAVEVPGARGGWLLQEALDLLKESEERNHINLSLTACGAILRFSGDEKQRRVVAEKLEGYRSNNKLTPKQRGEATRYLALRNGEE